MKHWTETRQVVDRLDAVVRAGRRAALATVTGVRGSAYRKPGAKLLVEEDGATTGNVSGGCLEQDVREVALRVLTSGHMVHRTYRSRADDDMFGLGLGCEGEVDIMIEPAYVARPRERVMLDAQAPFAICTRLDDGSRTILTGEAMCETRSGVVDAVFIDCLSPPPRLTIYGSGADRIPLARLAIEVGFDLRPSGCEIAIVMTHNFARDCEHVRDLLDAGTRYIGVLGPRRRTARLLDTLAASDAERARVHGPVGLDIGAYGPEQIAVAIVAGLLEAQRHIDTPQDFARGQTCLR
jgi:xanthine dehydrogenase accessory factor